MAFNLQKGVIKRRCCQLEHLHPSHYRLISIGRHYSFLWNWIKSQSNSIATIWEHICGEMYRCTTCTHFDSMYKHQHHTWEPTVLIPRLNHHDLYRKFIFCVSHCHLYFSYVYDCCSQNTNNNTETMCLNKLKIIKYDLRQKISHRENTGQNCIGSYYMMSL